MEITAISSSSDYIIRLHMNSSKAIFSVQIIDAINYVKIIAKEGL